MIVSDEDLARLLQSVCPYEPSNSTRDATLWLRRFQPHRLPEWLAKHEEALADWIARERPPDYVYPEIEQPEQHGW